MQGSRAGYVLQSASCKIKIMVHIIWVGAKQGSGRFQGVIKLLVLMDTREQFWYHNISSIVVEAVFCLIQHSIYSECALNNPVLNWSLNLLYCNLMYACNMTLSFKLMNQKICLIVYNSYYSIQETGHCQQQTGMCTLLEWKGVIIHRLQHLLNLKTVGTPVCGSC